MANILCFIVNGENFQFEGLDDELYLQLSTCSNYAKTYIESCIEYKLILASQPIKQLSRIDNNSVTNLLQVEEEKSSKQSDSDWGTAETKLLVDKYELYLPLVGPMKRFKSKKVMWKQISDDIKNIFQICKSELQCENRYKTILKRKKKVSNNNHTSGSSRQSIQFEEELRKISAIDDSVEPEILRGVGKTAHKQAIQKAYPETSEEENENLPPQNKQKDREGETPPTKRSKNICETLIQIQKVKEENKERRHNEKLNVLKDLIEVLIKNK